MSMMNWVVAPALPSAKTITSRSASSFAIPEFASAPLVLLSQLMLDPVTPLASPGATKRKPELVGPATVTV